MSETIRRRKPQLKDDNNTGGQPDGRVNKKPTKAKKGKKPAKLSPEKEVALFDRLWVEDREAALTMGAHTERAYTAASRRGDRSLEARFESAKKASFWHWKMHGKWLNITEEIVDSEEMYEELEDPHVSQLRRQSALAQIQNTCNFGPVGVRQTPTGPQFVAHDALHHNADVQGRMVDAFQHAADMERAIMEGQVDQAASDARVRIFHQQQRRDEERHLHQTQLQRVHTLRTAMQNGAARLRGQQHTMTPEQVGRLYGEVKQLQEQLNHALVAAEQTRARLHSADVRLKVFQQAFEQEQQQHRAAPQQAPTPALPARQFPYPMQRNMSAGSISSMNNAPAMAPRTPWTHNTPLPGHASVHTTPDSNRSSMSTMQGQASMHNTPSTAHSSLPTPPTQNQALPQSQPFNYPMKHTSSDGSADCPSAKPQSFPSNAQQYCDALNASMWQQPSRIVGTMGPQMPFVQPTQVFQMEQPQQQQTQTKLEHLSPASQSRALYNHSGVYDAWDAAFQQEDQRKAQQQNKQQQQPAPQQQQPQAFMPFPDLPGLPTLSQTSARANIQSEGQNNDWFFVAKPATEGNTTGDNSAQDSTTDASNQDSPRPLGEALQQFEPQVEQRRSWDDFDQVDAFGPMPDDNLFDNYVDWAAVDSQ